MTNLPERNTGSEDDKRIQPGTEYKKKYRKREAIGWTVSLAAAVIIALALRFFVFEFVCVDGESMLPVLCSDEYVFMEKVAYWFSGPQRGDIVICSFPDSEDSYIKRVVGLPGDRVEVENGVLYINGTPDHDYFTGVYDEDTQEFTVPENSAAVMGDNRNNSTDSRRPEVGPIPYDKIQGKADFIVWPLDKIGGL